MNMGSLERQLMTSFKDMEVKEKEKEQKDAAQLMTKEEAHRIERVNKKHAIKFGPKFKKKRKTRNKMAKTSKRANR